MACAVLYEKAGILRRKRFPDKQRKYRRIVEDGIFGRDRSQKPKAAGRLSRWGF
jgi:hypothetical protein